MDILCLNQKTRAEELRGSVTKRNFKKQRFEIRNKLLGNKELVQVEAPKKSESYYAIASKLNVQNQEIKQVLGSNKPLSREGANFVVYRDAV